MKKHILTAIILTIAMMAQATIYNVDNKSNRPNGYITNLQLAISNASAGDTIYIYPSNISYGNITITKTLHLFGDGYYGSDGTISKIDNLYLDTTSTPNSNPSGTTIQGLTMANLHSHKPNIKNIEVKGNYIQNYISIHSVNATNSGWVISNNYINYISVNNNNSIVITNNVFKGDSHGVRSSNSSSVVISNNIFMAWSRFSNIQNATVSNNIFICSGNSYTGGNMNNNVFTNNLSYCSNSSYNYTLPPQGNSGSGNLQNQNPQFVTGSLAGYYDITKDYHLQSASPAINAGSDGTDIGQYGGTVPFVWGKAFTIPAVTELLISNPVINQGTDININIKAKKADL